VPAYNEGPVIRGVARSLCSEFRNVVVVNDGSTDSTPDALRGLAITVLNHAVNLGQGAAIQTGLTYALSRGARWLVTFDSDGQHRLEDVKRMVSHIQLLGADAVFGSRFLGATNAPRMRRAILRLAVWFSNATTGTKLTDTHNGLRVLTRKAACSLHITHNGMAHASQIISQLTEARIPIVELPVTIDYTEYSMKKGQSASSAVDIVLELLIGRLLK
jgi:polyprenyl-phospho-N-acetylgalactosaminyl synthase